MADDLVRGIRLCAAAKGFSGTVRVVRKELSPAGGRTAGTTCAVGPTRPTACRPPRRQPVRQQ